MLRVPLDQVRPGMQIALEILHPRTGKRLLAEGFELDRRLIEKLQDLTVREIWVDYPNTEEIKQYVSPIVVRRHSRLVSMIADLFDGLHQDAHAKFEYAKYKRTLRGLVEALAGEPMSAAYILEVDGEADSDLRHATEVCFLSVLLGLKLQGYLVTQRKRLGAVQARNVIDLGVGAMMHDIGRQQLEEEVRERFAYAIDETDEDWCRHPRLGHHFVTGSIPPAASGVVLHHHQHFDGSGFPTIIDDNDWGRGLIGEEIHVFARIVCVANHFDRLRNQSEGGPRPRVRVLREMLMSELTRRFDPVVLAALPLVVPAYAPGSIVTLNDGRIAVIREWHPDSPCQPTIQFFRRTSRLDGDGERMIVDMRERADLLIVEQDGEDVSKDNFRLTTRLAEMSPAV